MGGFAPLCHSRLPMINDKLFWLQNHPFCEISHDLPLFLFLLLTLFQLWAMRLWRFYRLRKMRRWIRHISIELKKTVTWRGSSDGSVRYGGRGSICGICSVSHKANWCLQPWQFSKFPTQRFYQESKEVEHSLENEASERLGFFVKGGCPSLLCPWFLHW